MNFNKQLFAELLKSAKGERSINKYALESDVDVGYISRLLRCLVETAPSAIIINKLSNVAYNSVTAEQLMAAAGYIENIYENTEDEPDIRAIARAAHKLTPEQRKKALKMLKIAFDEVFDEND